MMFSVVIPCRNEEKFISGCIESILNNGYPHDDLEILVADGLSTDNTPAIIKQFESNYNCVKYLRNEKQYTPAGLNLGIKASSGEYLMILGAHAKLLPGYIQRCIELFETNSEADCIGGYVEHVPENDLSEAIARAMSHPFGVGNAHFRTARFEGYVDTVAFGTYRKNIFQSIGLFDENLVRNQDDEFSFRMKKNGYKIFLSSSLRSVYYVRSSFRKLARQYYQYGYWKVYVNRKHRSVTTIRQLIPPAFVLAVACSLAAVVLFPFLRIVVMGGALIYFLFAVITSLKLSSTFSGFLALPVVFLLLHLSYGWGWWNGVFHFAMLKRDVSSSSKALTR